MVHDKRPDADPDRWDNVLIQSLNSASSTNRLWQIIFKTTNIWDESTWSDAVHFKFQGYDTSPYWAEDGTTYMLGAHAWKVGYVFTESIC